MPGETKSVPSSLGSTFLTLMSNFWVAATAFTEALHPQMRDDFWDTDEPEEQPVPTVFPPKSGGPTLAPNQNPIPTTTPPPQTKSETKPEPKPQTKPEPQPKPVEGTTQPTPTPLQTTPTPTPTPTPPKKTFSELHEDFLGLKPLLTALLVATGDVQLSNDCKALGKADRAKNIDTLQSALNTCEAQIEELARQITVQLKNVERLRKEAEVAFRRQLKRIGPRQGEDLRLDYEQSEIIVKQTVINTTARSLQPGEPSLAELLQTLAAMSGLVDQMAELPDEADAPPEEEPTATTLPGNLAGLEYPFGAANKIPHIHNYASGFHLKYFTGTRVTRLNLVQDGKHYEANITEALDYARTYNQTPTQQKLVGVLETLLAD